MKIGLLGTGAVSKALGRGFTELGHQVMIGSRDRASSQAKASSTESGASHGCGTFAEASAFGELLVLAVLGTAIESAIELARPEHFRGKIVIDTTNPLNFTSGFPISLSIGQTDSGGEMVQRMLPGARVVKAFSTVGAISMVRPAFVEGRPDMFICGDDDGAKNEVAQICDRFGWGVIDLGPIQASRCLEPMALAWVIHGLKTGKWTHAFKLLSR